MMVRAIVLAFLMVAVPLAGCLAPEAPDLELEPTGLGHWDLNGVDLTGTPDPVDKNETWSTWEVQANGAAGTWLVLYRHLPVSTNPGSEFEYEYSFDAQAQGSGDDTVGLYTLPPQIVTGNETRKRPTIDDVRAVIDHDGGVVTRADDVTRSWHFMVGSGGIVGLLAIFGSNAPWTLNMTVTIEEEGNVTGPTFAAAGSGVTVSGPGQNLVESPGVLSVGSYSNSHDIGEVGLTHIELFWDQSLAVTGSSFRLLRVGYADHAFDSNGGRNPSVFGYFPDGPGTAFVDMTYYATSNRYDAALMHLPGGPEMFPEDFHHIISYLARKGALSEDVMAVEVSPISSEAPILRL